MKYINKHWVIITIVLSVVFIMVFLPLTIKSVGSAKATSYTVTGVAVIWIVYFVRAYLFSGFDSKQEVKEADEEKDTPEEEVK